MDDIEVNTPCRCGSGLPGYWNGDYCVECSPFDLFCDDCPDRERCEFKCRRDAITESLCDTAVMP